MKYFVFIFCISCTYNDLCPRDVELAKINHQLKTEYSRLKQIDPIKYTDNFLEQQDVIESLEIEKIILQNQPCK
jgi:hypothetical protein